MRIDPSLTIGRPQSGGVWIAIGLEIGIAIGGRVNDSSSGYRDDRCLQFGYSRSRWFGSVLGCQMGCKALAWTLFARSENT